MEKGAIIKFPDGPMVGKSKLRCPPEWHQREEVSHGPMSPSRYPFYFFAPALQKLSPSVLNCMCMQQELCNSSLLSQALNSLIISCKC